jgi:hypothetical protein
MLKRVGISFASRVELLLGRVTYKRIDTAAGLDSIHHLRYLAYLKEGAIEPNSDERLIDTFDETENAYVFGVYIDGELASAIRLHVLRDTSQTSPALETFQDAIAPLLRAGETILDPNRFVAAPSMARLYPELPFITLRPAYMASAHFKPHKVTVTCRAEHQAFYVRHMFATLSCSPRPYPTLNKPLSLMLVNFAQDHQRILDRNPYWGSSAADREAMFGAAKPSDFKVAQPSASNALRRVASCEAEKDGSTSAETTRGWLVEGASMASYKDVSTMLEAYRC